MSNEIHQHPDGHFIVRVDDKIYIDDSKNLRKDFGGPGLPDLPDGIDERVYHQGVRHALVAKNSVVDGGPMPWSVGDNLFSKIDAALTKQKKRNDDDKDAKKKKVDDDTKAMQKETKDNVDRIEAENKKISDKLVLEADIRNAQMKTHHDGILFDNRAKEKAEKDERSAIKAKNEKERAEKEK